jgi:hypothetical protein
MRFYTDKKLNSATKEFIAYVRSVPGQTLAGRTGLRAPGRLRLPSFIDTP